MRQAQKIPDSLARVRLLGAALALLLGGTPLLLGAIFPWAIALAGLISTLCLAAAYSLEQRDVRPRHWTWFELLWLSSIVWTAVQVIPLPFEWLVTLRPEIADIWKLNAEAFGVAAPRFAPLSFDPGTSYLELCKALIVFAAIVCMRSFVRNTNARAGLILVGLSVTLMACVAFAHRFTHAQAVFGIYQPVHAYSRLLAPLMNENHLGGLLMFATPILIGLALEESKQLNRIFWSLCALVTASGCVLTMSRGAIGVLCISSLALGVLSLRRCDSSRKWLYLGAAMFSAILIACIIFATPLGSQLRKEYSYTHNLTSKAKFAEESLPIIQAYPMLGVGRGAFAAVSAHNFGSERRVYHPENFVVQWVTEWGMPFACFFLGALFALYVKRWRYRPSLTQACALLGIGALLAHNIVDFSLEILGVAVVAWGSTAILLNQESRWELRRSMILGTGVLVGILSGFVVTLHRLDLYTLDVRFREAITNHDAAQIGLLADAARALHPADPLVAVAHAEDQIRTNPEKAARAINFALTMAPQWDSSHLAAAEWLLQQGYFQQALVEIRLAEQVRAGSSRGLVCRLSTEIDDLNLISVATPRGTQEGAAFLDRITQCPGATAEKIAWLDLKALQLDPQTIGPALRQARRLEKNGEAERALALLRSLPTTGPNSQQVRLALASLLFRLKQFQDADQVVQPLLDNANVADSTLLLGIRIAAAQQDFSKVEELAARWRSHALSDRVELARLELKMSAIFEQYKRFTSALDCAERALKYNPSKDTVRAALRLARVTGNADRLQQLQLRWCISQRNLAECRTIGLPP